MASQSVVKKMRDVSLAVTGTGRPGCHVGHALLLPVAPQLTATSAHFLLGDQYSNGMRPCLLTPHPAQVVPFLAVGVVGRL